MAPDGTVHVHRTMKRKKISVHSALINSLISMSFSKKRTDQALMNLFCICFSVDERHVFLIGSVYLV